MAVHPHRQRRSTDEPFDLAAEAVDSFPSAGGRAKAPAELEPAKPDPRKRIDSAAILAALTAEDRSAIDVAAAVGYTHPGALLDRVRRNPDAFAGVVVSKRGGRALLRLAAPA